ncbi:MAG: glycosyl transferase family 4, partial [Halanaerobiaceae bacterium]
FLNLLDLRPGRSIKFFLFFVSVLLIINPGFYLYFIPILLITLFYLPGELDERIMLGDCGANSLGAILGFGFAAIDFTGIKIILLLLLSFLTILSEFISFSQAIKNNKVLYRLDRLGRKNV